VFHSRYPGWNACAANNGGCAHLCIANVQSADSVSTSYHCACATHYTLSADNRTCQGRDIAPPSRDVMSSVRASRQNRFSNIVLTMCDRGSLLKFIISVYSYYIVLM